MFQATRLKIKAFIVWLMMINDTPRSLAMGVAVGLFIALTPTVGVQMLLVALASMFIRCTRTAGCAMVWLTNPVTMVPVFYFNYRVGTTLLMMDPVRWHDFVAHMEKAFSYEQWYEKLYVMVKALGVMSLDLAGPLWLGSVIVGLVAALPSYFLMRQAVVAYRRAHQRRIEAAIAREAGVPNVSEDSSDGKTLQDR
jgi:hypothetical protein